LAVVIQLPIPALQGLHTDRLRFRPLCSDDVHWWMGYINDAEAIRFMPFRIGSMDDCQRMIRRSLERYEKDGSGLHALERLDTGEPIGQCGLLTQEVDGRRELEIGYHLLPPASTSPWRTGWRPQ
jgi:RimJ/RimL family protein N-acetyltransferase